MNIDMYRTNAEVKAVEVKEIGKEGCTIHNIWMIFEIFSVCLICKVFTAFGDRHTLRLEYKGIVFDHIGARILKAPWPQLVVQRQN